MQTKRVPGKITLIFLAILQCINCQCPEPALISPCTCSNSASGNSVFCEAANADQIRQAFQQPFPSNNVDSVYILAILFPEFPADIFGDKTVRRITLECADIYLPLTSIHPDTFRSSENYTTYFSVAFCDLDNVSFSFLDNFNRLETLQLLASKATELRDLPLLPNLESTFVVGTKLEKWFNTWNTPRLASVELRDVGTENVLNLLQSLTMCDNLQYIYLGKNDLTFVPEQLKRFKRLKTISLYNNPITALVNGSLHLNSKLIYLDFYKCPVAHIETGAFEGDFSATNLYLKNTLLQTMDEDVFSRLLGLMYKKNGSINIDDVPLSCGCDLKWLIQNSRQYLPLVQKGRCANGTALEDLNPDGYNECD